MMAFRTASQISTGRALLVIFNISTDTVSILMRVPKGLVALVRTNTRCVVVVVV